MKVKSLIKRKKGHKVEMGNKVYNFGPENNYEEDVRTKSHLARFMQIPEGYEVVGLDVDDDEGEQPEGGLRPAPAPAGPVIADKADDAIPETGPADPPTPEAAPNPKKAATKKAVKSTPRSRG